MEDKIKNIQKNYLQKILEAEKLSELDEIFLGLFGKNGELTILVKDFPNTPKEELQKIVPLFKETRTELENSIESRREEVKEEGYKKLEEETIDITESPKITPRTGHLHPITAIEHEIVELFHALGFQQFSAPHIDTDEFNFEVLNIPKGHPARDLWDTLYINTEGTDFVPGELLLRTHTSNSQVRIIRENKPPIRMMVVDRCFRYENLDPRHEHTFQQFEAVLVDKGLSVANLQYLSEYFLKAVFGKDIKVRLVPKYFPFVEPGAAVEGECIFCKGKGCRICGKGWLELAGAGMIHPTVIKNGGLDPKVYSGIAWGFGPDRIAMLKYGVSDIRLFRSGDLNFLEALNESK